MAGKVLRKVRQDGDEMARTLDQAGGISGRNEAKVSAGQPQVALSDKAALSFASHTPVLRLGDPYFGFRARRQRWGLSGAGKTESGKCSGLFSNAIPSAFGPRELPKYPANHTPLRRLESTPQSDHSRQPEQP